MTNRSWLSTALMPFLIGACDAAGTTPGALDVTPEAIIDTAPEVASDAGDTVAGDPAAARIAHGEELFFRALAGETELRAEAIAELAAGVEMNPEHARGQLMYGMALLSSVVEDQDFFAALKAGPALDKAAALAPDDLRIPGWIGTVKVGSARAFGGAGLDEAIQYMIDAADLFPEFNNVSLAISFGRLPLDTPYPQMAIDRLLAIADCNVDFDVCRNTARIPHNNEGALMLFGDLYARVGDSATARTYYQQALASPDAATWDYADLAQATLDDLDQRVALYLDADAANDPPFFAEGPVACVACHAP